MAEGTFPVEVTPQISLLNGDLKNRKIKDRNNVGMENLETCLRGARPAWWVEVSMEVWSTMNMTRW